MSLAAGVLPNDEDSIARWIVDNQHIKPKNRMPPFGVFNEGELALISQYLGSLK
jgi:cytochrome c oxidase subunit 2